MPPLAPLPPLLSPSSSPLPPLLTLRQSPRATPTRSSSLALTLGILLPSFPSFPSSPSFFSPLSPSCSPLVIDFVLEHYNEVEMLATSTLLLCLTPSSPRLSILTISFYPFFSFFFFLLFFFFERNKNFTLLWLGHIKLMYYHQLCSFRITRQRWVEG